MPTLPHVLFSEITANGLSAIREGRTSIESPPRGGGRWGLSAVFRLTGPIGANVDALTREALGMVGPGHWCTGCRGSAHVTIRALEPYSEDMPSRLELDRYKAAVRRAVAGLDPVRFDFSGLAVSPGTLMMCAGDIDGVADHLRRRLHTELDQDGWLENSHFAKGRDPIWYVTLVHFARALERPDRFLGWFAANELRSSGRARFGQVDLCRWGFDATRMMPDVVVSVGFGR